MNSTATTTATYRKTKTGEWVVMAPAARLTAGGSITVTKKDGTTKLEMIGKVGKTFEVNGIPMAYGYLDPTYAPAASAGSRRKTTTRPSSRCRECGGEVQSWSDGAGSGYCHDCV